MTDTTSTTADPTTRERLAAVVRAILATLAGLAAVTVRRLRQARPVWTMDMRSEARAGLADARRTPGAVWWHGSRYGCVSYAAGYAYGAVTQRVRVESTQRANGPTAQRPNGPTRYRIGCPDRMPGSDAQPEERRTITGRMRRDPGRPSPREPANRDPGLASADPGTTPKP